MLTAIIMTSKLWWWWSSSSSWWCCLSLGVLSIVDFDWLPDEELEADLHKTQDLHNGQWAKAEAKTTNLLRTKDPRTPLPFPVTADNPPQIHTHTDTDIKMYIFESENKIKTATVWSVEEFQVNSIIKRGNWYNNKKEIYKWQSIKILVNISLNAYQELMKQFLFFRKSFKLPFALSRLEKKWP